MLEKLAIHQDLWIKMLINLGCSLDVAKDLVQDMYLKLHRLVKDESRIMYKDEINRYFVWVTLRNLYFSYLKDKKKFHTYELKEWDDVTEVVYDYNEDDAFSVLMDNIQSITSEWSSYNKRLFNLYFIKGLSLREISKGANIGLTSIHNSIINQRQILKEHLSEDLIDYFNQDFDKI